MAEQYGMSKKQTSYTDVLNAKHKINLFDFGGVKQSQPTQIKQMNFGQPVSQRNVTNFADYQYTLPKQTIQQPTTQKSGGFGIIPTANASNDKMTIEQFGETIKQKYPQYKDIDSTELGNKMIEKYPQYKDKIVEDKGPDGFTGAVMGTVEGAISQVPAFAANLGGAFNKYVTAPASAVLGENLFGVPREQNPLYKGAMKLAGETQKTGEELKKGIKKFGVAKDNTTSQKVGEELTNIGGSMLIPGGVLQKGVPLGSQLTRGAVQGTLETMKYTAGARGELPTGTEAVVGAVLPLGLGVVGNQLGKVKNKLMVSGLMTPAKLTQAKQRIITEVGEEAVKELDNVIKTPDDVSKWLLDRGIKGDKEEIIQQLIKNAENSKQMVDNQLASVNEYIAAGAPEMDNARKALDVLFDAYKDDIGNQGIFNKITSYIGKLQEKGGGLTVSEMNDIKRLIDRSELNPYTLVGKVRAGKSGLNNIRNGLKQDIENIAERNGVEGIKILNNNTSVSRFMAEAIGKKNDSEMARELVSVFAPRLVGGAIGGTTGGPFNEKTTEGKIGNFLFGAFVGGALGSTKFKTNLANFINKLTPSEKGAIQNFINSRGQSNIPKDIYNKLLKFREGNKIISKETKNVSNINNNLTNNIQLKPSILSTREKALLKPNSTTNVSNKTNIEPKKTGRELLKKVLPSNFKEKAQDFVEGVADKVGARTKLMGNEGIGADKTKLLKGNIDYNKIEQYYKNKLGTDDVSEIMKRVKSQSIETQQNILKKANSEIKKVDTKGNDFYGMEHRPTKNGATGDDITKNGVIPKDVYTNPEYYFNPNDKTYKESLSVLKKIKGNPNAEVTIYRAGAKNEFNEGDWITLSKTYAQEHMERVGSKGVFSIKVKAKDIQFAGDDINEFGYFPQKTKLLKPSDKGLIEEANNSILKRYSGNSDDFNKSARQGIINDNIIKLDNYIYKNTSNIGITYRGVNPKEGGFFDSQIKNIKNNGIEDKGFMTSTTNFEDAKIYTGKNKILLEIQNTKGVEIPENISPYGDKGEVILPRGTKLKYIGEYEKDGFKIIQLKQIYEQSQKAK